MRRCDLARRRIEAGVALLQADPVARDAFCRMNRVMVDATLKRRPGTTPAWHPFQLAFVLLTLTGSAHPDHADREAVDLLYFPTGGGKTEAYLGLAAFVILLRRLRDPSAASDGVTVIMRYTLRLLTIDQLERAAGLVCALELMRRKVPEQLGKTPFEVGLWVGGKTTPNQVSADNPRWDSAESRTVAYKRAPNVEPRPVPIERCPWCLTALKPEAYQLIGPPGKATDFRLQCTHPGCEFASAGSWLPMNVIDETVYRRVPCFLIATVDKFAAVPLRGSTATLFGRVGARYPDGAYAAPSYGLKGAVPCAALIPPELIIQDELHLISGPLGTVAGVYEAAFEALWSSDDGRPLALPKIVASTATVRRADAQVRALFGRTEVDVFPPPGPDRNDSFFATATVVGPDGADPRRQYLGVAAQGRSLKVVLLRSYVALLGAAQRLWQEAKASGDVTRLETVDPYMTLVGYFSALRELGGSRRITEDEVRTRLTRIGLRRRLGEKPGPFADRTLDLEGLVELTSRVPMADVSVAKARLGYPMTATGRVDVALATNMISVGVDVSRLGLMVVLGQPKATAEYIQATSRVGRDRGKPGLVVVLLNVHRPRDRSHYERFEAFHASFYRGVEATTVTPFAARALDRALPAAVATVVRHQERAHVTEIAARNVTPAMEAALVRRFGDRARRQGASPAAQAALVTRVEARVRQAFHDWRAIVADAGSAQVSYFKERFLDAMPVLRLPEEALSWAVIDPAKRRMRAAWSMREVEPSIVTFLPPDIDKSPKSRAQEDSVRRSALLTTAGVGSFVDFPDASVLVRGLDDWRGEYEEAGGKPRRTHPQAGAFIEAPQLAGALAAVLKVSRVELRYPPQRHAVLDDSGVQTTRFPAWFLTEPRRDGTRELLPLGAVTLDKRRRVVSRQVRQGEKHPARAVPIRFVQACPNGHVSDIDWKGVVHAGTPCGDERLVFVERGNSGDLGDIEVRCEGCQSKVKLPDLQPDGNPARLGECRGERPWIGDRQECEAPDTGRPYPNRLLVRHASNAYFALTHRVIVIPEQSSPVAQAVVQAWNVIGDADSAGEVAVYRKAAAVRALLQPFTDELIFEAIQRHRKPELVTGGARGQEAAAFHKAADEVGEEAPEADFTAARHPSGAGDGFERHVDRVVLVHRLREVVAQYGFTRIDAPPQPLDGELRMDVMLAALASKNTWLPAIENRGEGIYLALDAAAVEAWKGRPEVAARATEFADRFRATSKLDAEPDDVIVYALLHSLSHLLLTAVSLECGYSAASIRERIYALPGRYGVLLYTSSPDSEGTLGGLVETGRNLGRHLKASLRLGALCSNDPVCAGHTPAHSGDDRSVHGAACHGCLLIAESSCERRNELLDRALVVPTLGSPRALAFFADVPVD